MQQPALHIDRLHRPDSYLPYRTMATVPSYPPLRSQLDLRGPQFKQNKDSWVPVLDKFEDRLKQVCAEGNQVSLERHQSRGQLLGTLAERND